jgi:hypothetical protein
MAVDKSGIWFEHKDEVEQRLPRGETATYTASGSINKDAVGLAILDGATLAMTLADGAENQEMWIKAVNVTSTTVTPENFADGTNLTFDTNGEVALVKFDGTNWQLLYTTATLA